MKPKDWEDIDAKHELFAAQIEWYEATHEAYVEQQKDSGKLGTTIQSMLKPFYALVSFLLTRLNVSMLRGYLRGKSYTGTQELM